MKRVLQQLGVYKKDTFLCVVLTTLEVIMEILLPFITARLLEEGLEGLQAAKASHDALEKVYNGSVDFGGVYALAEREWDRIAGWL